MTAWASFGQQETAEYQGTGGTISFVRRFLFGPGIAEASYGYDVFQQPPVGSGAASSQQRGPKGAHGSLPRFTDAPGIDQSLVSINAADARTYQFQDALGSVILATNAAGQITEKYGYTAYGVTLYAGANTAAYRYTGRRYDAETGLYFYRNRAYSPALGRFLQTDPLGTDGGINLYAYVGNDPVNHVDPIGLAAEEGMDPNILSGHGGWNEEDGELTVPNGTSVTVWTSHGNTISDELGNLIETGNESEISMEEFPETEGARSYLPGSTMPNYTLYPPNWEPPLNIMGNPTTVSVPTTLNSLLQPGMGNVQWAACLYCGP